MDLLSCFAHPLKPAFAIVVGAIFCLIIARIRRAVLSARSEEPPELPYWIPWLGHALAFGSNSVRLFLDAQSRFPGKPFSLTVTGQRIYVFTQPRDINAVYRNSRTLSFHSIVEWALPRVFGLSQEGLGRLLEPDAFGNSLLLSYHPFVRDALKPGPELDYFTSNFLEFLNRTVEVKQIEQGLIEVSLLEWVRKILGSASTDALLGPAFRERHPEILSSLFTFDAGFFKFAYGLPKWLAWREHLARDTLLNSLEEYFATEDSVEALPMIQRREKMLRDAGLKNYDRAVATLTIYFGLVTNSIPSSFWLLLHVYTNPNLVKRIRAEVDPAFDSSGKIVDIDHILTRCPLLRSTFNETLRTSSASTSSRKVTEDTVIAGYVLKKGAIVMCPSRPQHIAEEHWGFDVDRFNPERFLQKGGNELKPSVLRPFGGGTSLCSGRFFASNQVLSFVATVVMKFDLTVKNDKVPQVDEKTPNLGVMGPDATATVRVIARKLG